VLFARSTVEQFPSWFYEAPNGGILDFGELTFMRLGPRCCIGATRSLIPNLTLRLLESRFQSRKFFADKPQRPAQCIDA
jgi:hypothetical protein